MTTYVATPPRWDLTNIYPGLESEPFQGDMKLLEERIAGLESSLSAEIAVRSSQDTGALAAAVGKIITQFNAAYTLSITLNVYIYSFVATDSFNATAKRLLSEFEQVDVRLHKLEVRLRSLVGSLGDQLPEVIAQDATAKEHAFFLLEEVEQSKYMMSEAEETLAAELNLSGANAWGKLQGTLTSQLSVDFELDGEMQKLPMPALINLHSHPDPETRKRAYHAELAAWDTVSEALAAALNGVKGEVSTLNLHRGRSDALHSAIDAARIDRETLEVMLEAMRASFPMFRRYFKAKAARFGKDRLPWWDLFAPSVKNDSGYTFSEARQFILDHFERFNPGLAAFARRAFDHNWIDAEQRPGKRGGGFCLRIPGVKESRILCNFDGSLDQVGTIAHELGHAYHNECLFQAGKTPLQSQTPMTLAETASILCETIVVEAAMAAAASPAEELAILESSLIGSSQVVVDIYSRFLFEREVFERRARAELSVQDLNDIMERAQKATYGDGLDEKHLHRYMWTWKPHYYRSELSFYNFPYAFGLLFGIGLYAVYQQRGRDFIPDYENLLASTGEGTAAELAARFGIDIRQPAFWNDSLQVIGAQIERYCAL